jgi:hypothetical protein
MKFTNSWTGNWENAFRGLRHPMESYAKSDSDFGIADSDEWLEEAANEILCGIKDEEEYEIAKDKLYDSGILRWGKNSCEYAFLGPNDIDLAQRMIKAGTPNDKFLRQIFVSVDITAPLYWWKEMDTYKVATVANSTSTMHKLASTPITKECFEMDDYEGHLLMYEREPYDLDAYTDDMWDNIINYCETLRKSYLETKDIRYWKELIRILPESWLQTRTWTANYATLRGIYYWRKNHKLTEWHQFCDWVKTLPYADELITFEN